MWYAQGKPGGRRDMRQPVSLTDEERQHLHMFVHRGKANARSQRGYTRYSIHAACCERAKEQDQRSFFCECMVNCSCSRHVWLQRALKDRALPHSARSLLARSHAKQGGMLFTSDTSEVEI